MPKTVLSVCVGRVQPLQLDGRLVQSAIRKQPVSGPVIVTSTGLEGDEQADLAVHGGLQRAVYAYPVEHYPHWQTMRAQASAAPWNAPLPHGAMGENLTIEGLLEADAWIGDLLKFPNCVLAVSEPRLPNVKLSATLGFRQAAQMMTQSRWCGFYLAVRVAGTIAAGEAYELIPGPREVGIAERFSSLIAKNRRLYS
jgi:MOSC domain-containing protein YiiM